VFHSLSAPTNEELIENEGGKEKPVFFWSQAARMFNFRKERIPQPLHSNPGKGFNGSVAFTNSQKSWVERFDLVSLLAASLKSHGHQAISEDSHLVLENSAFSLLPQFVEIKPLAEGGVQTTTTIQTSHASMVPEGVFEYQHSTGRNVEESFLEGFNQWAKTDLVTLLDSIQAIPSICSVLKMEIPEKNEAPAYCRRAVLGPVMHLQQYPSDAVGQKGATSGEEILGDHKDCHDFCPCCLLTSSFEAFKELVESTRFYGLRLYAMRNQSGNPQADCRVNGNDWEKGAEALRTYVGTWPKAGVEFRKQYVVLQTIDDQG